MRCIAALFLLGSLAGAVPITFTVEGTASGVLYQPNPFDPAAVSSTFTTQSFRLDLFSDTSLLTGASIPVSAAIVSLGGSSGADLDGLNLAAGIGPGEVTLYKGPFAGNVVFGLGNSSLQFVSYGLSTSIGPLSVDVFLNPNTKEEAPLIDTTFGTVVLSNLSDATFAADLPGTETPEPASYALSGLGVALVWLFRRRASFAGPKP